MWKTGLAFVAFIGALPAIGQEASGKASIEAVEACKAVSNTFSDMATCLPDMDTALAVLAAFSEIYPDAGEPLKDRCLELNDSEIGADICVRKAIESAVSLSDSLPSGASLDDPIFDAVRNADDLIKIEEIRQTNRGKFPNNSGAGFSTYQPYR